MANRKEPRTAIAIRNSLLLAEAIEPHHLAARWLVGIWLVGCRRRIGGRGDGGDRRGPRPLVLRRRPQRLRTAILHVGRSCALRLAGSGVPGLFDLLELQRELHRWIDERLDRRERNRQALRH